MQIFCHYHQARIRIWPSQKFPISDPQHSVNVIPISCVPVPPHSVPYFIPLVWVSICARKFLLHCPFCRDCLWLGDLLSGVDVTAPIWPSFCFWFSFFVPCQMSFFSVLLIRIRFLSAECFFWGLKASPVVWMSCTEPWGTVNCNFWSKKIIFFQLYFFLFWSLNPGPDPDPLEMLIPDSLNIDPQNWLFLTFSF